MAMSLLVRMFVGALTLQVAAGLTASEKANVVAKQQASLQGMSTTDPLAMLESVEKMAHSGETINPSAALSIKGFVQTIRDTLADQKKVAFDDEALKRADLNTCVAPAARSEDTATIGYRTTHTSCRTAQYATPATTHCAALTTFLGDIPADPTSDWPTWEKATPTPAEREAQVNKIKEYDGMKMCNGAQATTLKSSCDSESSTSGDKEAECLQDQLRFEASYCTMASLRESTCTAYTTCVTDKTSAYTIVKTSYTDMLPKYKIEHKALAKIDCFCDVWIASDSADADKFAGCETKDAEYTTAANDFLTVNFNDCATCTALPTAAACALFTVTPGTAGFLTTEYTAYAVATVGSNGIAAAAYPCTTHFAASQGDSGDLACAAITDVAHCPLNRCAVSDSATNPGTNVCGEKAATTFGGYCEDDNGNQDLIVTDSDYENAEACKEECTSTHSQPLQAQCTAYAYNAPAKECSLYKNGPYTKGSNSASTTIHCYIASKGGLLELKTNKTKAPAQLMELHADGTMDEEPTQHHKKRSMIRRETKATKRHAHLDAQGHVAHEEANKHYSPADLQSMDMGALMNLMKSLDINTKDVKAAMEKSILNAKV